MQIERIIHESLYYLPLCSSYVKNLIIYESHYYADNDQVKSRWDNGSFQIESLTTWRITFF